MAPLLLQWINVGFIPNFSAIANTSLNLLSWSFAYDKSPSSAVAKCEYNPSILMVSIWCACCKNSSACSSGIPNRVIPVSTLRCTRSLLSPWWAFKASKSSKEDTFKSRLWVSASESIWGFNLEYTRMSAVMPASRNSIPSSMVKTAKCCIPSFSNVCATWTAPWPYPFAFTVAIIGISPTSFFSKR